MRKLLVLIMTSVLATGAVANADDVNVVKDPADYITIGPILEDDGTTTAATLDPSYATDDANRKYYIMEADFVNPAGQEPSGDLTFQKASLCLYDPAVAATDAAVDSLCGSKPGIIGAGLTNGQNRPHEALQVVVGGTISNATSNFHAVKAYGSGSNLVVSASGLRSYEVHFALSHATANTTGWKIRALVEYDTSADPVYLELTDDANTYNIDTFRAIDTQRTQVTYADVIPGESSQETGITTGTYFANHTVSINMEATEFTDGSAAVPFSTTDPGATNEFGLECVLDGTSLFITGTAGNLVGNADASSLGGSEAAKTLTTHDCTLKAGSAVDPDSYDNAVTIGIGAGS